MQNVPHSSTSTPSTFGLPDFLLDQGYLGLQTPQIVGMNNPVTAFKENKQLRCHETPFDARYGSILVYTTSGRSREFCVGYQSPQHRLQKTATQLQCLICLQVAMHAMLLAEAIHPVLA